MLLMKIIAKKKNMVNLVVDDSHLGESIGFDDELIFEVVFFF